MVVFLFRGGAGNGDILRKRTLVGVTTEAVDALNVDKTWRFHKSAAIAFTVMQRHNSCSVIEKTSAIQELCKKNGKKS